MWFYKPILHGYSLKNKKNYNEIILYINRYYHDVFLFIFIIYYIIYDQKNVSAHCIFTPKSSGVASRFSVVISLNIVAK